MRNLEREIGAVCRNAAVRIAEGHADFVRVDKGDLEEILGPSRFEGEVAQRTSVPGVATGLAWTPVGGDILFIETSRTPGTGKLILTGQLGDVMKESAQAALTLVKSRAESFGIEFAGPGEIRRARARAGGRHPEGRARAQVSRCSWHWLRCWRIGLCAATRR